MKIRKRHIAGTLAAILLPSLYLLKEGNLKAERFTENFLEKTAIEIPNNYSLKELSNSYLRIPEKTNPPNFYDLLNIEEPTLENIDKEKRKVYLSEKEIENHINSLYSRISIPEEISKDIFKKIIKKESAYNIYALSAKNARGLGQILEETWNTLEKEIPYEQGVYNPSKNLEISVKFLKWAHEYNKKYNPNWQNANLKEKQAYLLSTYNWGPGNLKNNGNWNLNKIPKETENYLEYILNN